MHKGVLFPQTEIGTDPIAVRDYAQAAEELGYDHILIIDHVLGASVTHRPNWDGRYNNKDQFHEPFVLSGFMAAVTQRLELVTHVIILPQRQTALVAKQATEVDILSGGRLRLGVGIGWNQVEYAALGQAFHTRGKRIEEQIELLRLLFSEDVVTYNGRWDTIIEAGLNPLPVRRSIPIWIGGSADIVLQRVAKLGDGWFPRTRNTAECRVAIEKLYDKARAIGRDTKTIGIEGRLHYLGGNMDELAQDMLSWRAIGATHVGVSTMKAGLLGPSEHIKAISQVKAVIDSL